MAVKPVPNQCIWCLQDLSTATFNSESHVLPESIGNKKRQQVLPKGVVCDDCNNFFGTKLEPKLIDEPILSTLVAILGHRDPDSQFNYIHSPAGVHRKAYIETHISENQINVTTSYEIEGQPNRPNETRIIPKSKHYDKRALAFLSRAVHKIAFESVVHNEFVGTGIIHKNKEVEDEDIDVFHDSFNVIRKWVRCGKPQNLVRTVLCIQRFDEGERKRQLSPWGGETHFFQQGIYYKLNLFNYWYLISLTSSPDEVEDDLKRWAKKQSFLNPIWMVGDKLQGID